MQSPTITIIINFETVNYGLIVSRTATIRQVKKEIEKYLGIFFQDQVLSFNSIILNNDQTVLNYNINDEDELLLIEDQFQENLLNNDTELVEFNQWLDLLEQHFNQMNKFVQDTDYMVNMIHEMEHKNFSLELLEPILSRTQRCAERCEKLQGVLSQMTSKSSFLLSECNRFYNVMLAIQEKKRSITKRYQDHQLVPEATIKKNDTAPPPFTNPEPPRSSRTVDPFEEYLSYIQKVAISGSDTVVIKRSSSNKKTPGTIGSIIRSNHDDNGEDEDDRSEREKMIHMISQHMNQLPLFDVCGDSDDEEEDGDTRKYTPDNESAFVLLQSIEDHRKYYRSLKVLDLSYCNIGNNGFIQLVNILINNEDIMLRELHLAGNQITSNQIIYLISLLHIDITQSFYDQPVPKGKKTSFIFPSLRILDLNDNRLGNDGVKYLMVLLTNNVFPEIHQIFLLNNNITTEITSRLIDITLNEKNQINFVIPETQMPFYSSEEKKRILKLYSGIEKKVTPVIEIENKVSSSFLQLYLNTMVSSLRDVEKISFKNVPLSRNQFLMVISYIRRFIEYGRCEKLTCLNFRGCTLTDKEMKAICDILLLIAEKHLSRFEFINLEDNQFSAEALLDLITSVNLCREKGCNVDFCIIRNPIKDEGLAVYLQHYYKKYYDTIDSLNFSGCSITSTGIEYLHTVFQDIEEKDKLHVLQALNISNNPLTDGCVSNLTRVLSFLPCLHNIYIESADLSSTGLYGIIAHFIRVKPTQFLYICLRSNNIDETELSNLKEVISANFVNNDMTYIEMN